DGATMAWQRHGSNVTRADARGIVTPGTVYDHCDGLWSDEPGRAMLLLTADCMPIAIAIGMQSAVRSNIARPGSSLQRPSQWSYTVPGVTMPRASARVTFEPWRCH